MVRNQRSTIYGIELADDASIEYISGPSDSKRNVVLLENEVLLFGVLGDENDDDDKDDKNRHFKY